MELWGYAERSVAHIFGDATGDPIADKIVLALDRAGEEGLTRTDISSLCGRHEPAHRIDVALRLLEEHGRARPEGRATGGRPAEVWYAA